jgi:hypothetical protein
MMFSLEPNRRRYVRMLRCHNAKMTVTLPSARPHVMKKFVRECRRIWATLRSLVARTNLVSPKCRTILVAYRPVSQIIHHAEDISFLSTGRRSRNVSVLLVNNFPKSGHIRFVVWILMALSDSQTNSVAFSPQANYTDWSIAAGLRILAPTFAERWMSRG